MNAHQVLIIEDDRDAAGFYKTVLDMAGFECEISLSARDGLDRLAASAPDLILLDIRLGVEISGEDILYQIRSNPRFDKTRVVVVTAYPWLAEPISDLADLLLVKPIEVDQLKNLMQRLGSLDYTSKFQNYRDPVTELFNEEFFLTRLELAFERAKRRPNLHFAIIAIDVQLETLAEEPGRSEARLKILREVADRLKKFARPSDAVARLAGWKFVTLHEDLNNPEEIQLIVQRLSEKLSGSYKIDDTPYAVRFDFMPVVRSLQHQHPVDMLNAAKKAMNTAHTSS
jgi:diguanylate cyclase (GGDEF)-like protein